MSNHTITPRQAAATIAALIFTTIALVALGIALLIRGDATGDLLYSIPGLIALALALIPARLMSEIIAEWLIARRRRQKMPTLSADVWR